MGCNNPLDSKAKAIIRVAQDTNISLQKRAVDLVSSILRTYYSTELAKVPKIEYIDHLPEDDKKPKDQWFQGLDTTSSGLGAKATGVVRVVTSYFVDNTNERQFARRVLQVGHELQHIDQYRAKMTGANRSNEREFLAFTWEALADEKPSTGCMNAGTRLALLNGALKYYDKMAHDVQKNYTDQRAKLVARKTQEESVAAK